MLAPDLVMTMPRRVSSLPTVDQLNAVIIANEGSAEVLSVAASEIADPAVSEALERLAEHRKAQADRLREFFEKSEMDPPESSGLLETIRAYWLVVRGALTGGAAGPLLSSVLPAEEKLVQAYHDALTRRWSRPVERVLCAQLMSTLDEKAEEERLCNALNSDSYEDAVG